MPFMCFSYPDSPSAGTPGGAPAQPDLRMMPQMCFSYPAPLPVHVPPGIGSDIAEPGLGEPRRMPNTCFRY